MNLFDAQTQCLNLSGNGLSDNRRGLVNNSLISKAVVAGLSRVRGGRVSSLVVVTSRARRTSKAHATSDTTTDKLVDKQQHGEQEENPVHVKERNASPVLAAEAVGVTGAAVIGQSSRSRQVEGEADEVKHKKERNDVERLHEKTNPGNENRENQSDGGSSDADVNTTSVISGGPKVALYAQGNNAACKQCQTQAGVDNFGSSKHHVEYMSRSGQRPLGPYLYIYLLLKGFVTQ